MEKVSKVISCTINYILPDPTYQAERTNKQSFMYFILYIFCKENSICKDEYDMNIHYLGIKF